VSQCLWNDAAASEITAIISSSYPTNSSSSTLGDSKTSPSSISPAVLAGIIVGAVAFITVALLALFIFRQQKRLSSITKTETVELAAINKAKEDEDKMSLHPPGTPLPGYQKHDHARFFSSVDGELGTSGEIHQLPEAHHINEEDYLAASRRMESQRRAAGTVELGGRAMMVEVLGDLPPPVEMDDEWSRKGLLLSPGGVASRDTSRPSSRGVRGVRLRGRYLLALLGRALLYLRCIPQL
jgi:hypothetical protein